ncbi:D-glycerate dehydrogenase [Candidimonas sp. SYP-B2681]|uniref:2-hydroxyacid dehydrogenase n=1 Tax=Candidimonas sp. SYP-B2681 TaxID=2497686 RepID=UPI000F881568|nr:D-glycerate dehydrogenase [Candidimonas sp. SYP-B2681]RTZ41507.1 D-glycerate dehydrogenase [Candidimonas sp. SYP-B2681]
MVLSSPKPRAFLCRRFTESVEAALRKRYDLRINENDSILSPDDIVKSAQGSQVLFASATEQINESVLRQLSPRLRYVATLSVGYDHINTAVAQELGIGVLHTPDVLSDACSEIAMMLMLNACRRGYEADRMVRSGSWTGWSPTQLLGIGLKGKRVVVFGMGRIGQEIATRARAFGMEIHYHNRRRLPPEQEAGASYHADLDEAMQVADIFVIAAPGSAQLKGIINAERIARLPARAVIVNISRGELVDDDALIHALTGGRVFAAGLDVFANEPNVDPRYRELDNVFLSPHLGSATQETRDAMGMLLVDGLDALYQGRTPSNVLIPR